MARPDPLGRAMLDYQRGDYEEGDLRYRDGERSQRGYVAENYFGDPEGENEFAAARRAFVEESVLDVGCGAGRDALYFQQRRPTLAVDVSPGAVRTARERGVERVALADMFDLGLPDDGVRTVHSVGTQTTLARSDEEVRALLAEFARVTDADGRAVVDLLDPTVDAPGPFGHRPDPRTGVAWRTFHFEYDETVGRTLVFRLLSPARFRDAVANTAWSVADVRRRGPEEPHYAAFLTK